ncbi:MAG: YidC/Oxa1 family membrane protein insertase [Oscillospiraceae bacterium]|nr:YidC/Oxa1 family membrane protein insertase [Oscillospiraceae bacterium]
MGFLNTFMTSALTSLYNFLDMFIKNDNITYGLAIIFFTIIVRIILFPLQLNGTKSMMKTSKVQPEVKILQDKYKNDPQKLQKETMDLYKKNGINPLGGCIPMLLQFPFMIAMFAAFRNLPILDNIGFLFIKSLNGTLSKNYTDFTYFIMPVLTIITQYLMTKSSAQTQPQPQRNPKTGKVEGGIDPKIMNLSFTVFIAYFCFVTNQSFVLYYFISNLLYIAQNYIIKWMVDREELKKKTI